MEDKKEEKGIPFNENSEVKCSKCCRNCEAEWCPDITTINKEREIC